MMKEMFQIIEISSDESSEDEEEDELLEYNLFFSNSFRNPKLYRRRWDSNYFMLLALQENSFITEYRMDFDSFDSLVTMIRDSNFLNIHHQNAKNSVRGAGSDMITLESRVGAALIVLGGGRITEAMRTHGISSSQAYCNLRRVVRVINRLPALAITCSNDVEALEKRASRFEERSSHDMFQFCSGAIDGLAIKIEAPKKVLNQTQYYSGGKQMYCLNVQAVCDADGRVIAFSCKHAGSTNDAMAFQTSDIISLCQAQPFPYHWVGDLAYPLLPTLMTPFAGSQLPQDKDSFNFYLSQIRITIERVFGMIVKRWGILWKPLRFGLSFAVEVVHACMRLHSYCLRSTAPVPATETMLREDGTIADVAFANTGRETWEGIHVNVLREALRERILTEELFHSRSV